MGKIIDEIKGITAEQVAKKEDVAKLNFPNIIEKVKTAATLGDSNIRISTTQMNEYDKALLVAEGFSVYLVDRVIHPFANRDGQFDPYKKDEKEWLIKW